MIRKLILSAVMVAGTLTGLALAPAAASALPPAAIHRHDRHHVRFEVQVRHLWHWHTVGTYRERDDARRAAWMLERRGYDVRIEVEHGRW